MKRLRVGVVYGGRSGEHEVSLASASAVIANLDRTRYEPVPIYIERDGRWALADRPPSAARAADVIEHSRLEGARRLSPHREIHLLARPGVDTVVVVDRRAEGQPLENAELTGLALDVVFPVLHGPYGEDGTVQGLFELANIPYVGAGVLASAAGMDKAVMKVLFSAAGLPVVDHLLCWRRDILATLETVVDRVEARFAWPVFVKPANLGSSVGISKATSRATLGRALSFAAEFDRKVVVERGIDRAREIECAVLGNDTPDASVPGEIIPQRDFYDYEAKYLDDGSRTVIPAALSAEQTTTVRRLAIDAFRSVDAAGLARVDFLMNPEDDEIFVNEINTMPGFTTISMYSKLWEASGLPYSHLLDRLIELALQRQGVKQALRTTAL
ncbi:MAG: D-alanine--D-alanine ligase family protein [Vicinamibacterales bacterium]